MIHHATRFAKLVGHGVVVLTSASLLFPTAAMKKSESARPPALTRDYYEYGLHVVLPPGPLQHDRLVKALNNPYITAIGVQMNWSYLEPTEGKPEWHKLDEVFAAAILAKKGVGLSIFPGFFSPDWAKQGAQTAQFAIPYGPGAGKVESLPLPWDEVYLNRWFAFLKLLSDRYGNAPEFEKIGAAGPTSVSTEMSLPDRAKDQDLQKWIELGYTPSKYIAAWQKTFQTYKRYFPNQNVSLTFYPSLPINDQGKYAPGHDTSHAVIEKGIEILGENFEFQIADLTGHPKVAGAELMANYIGRVTTGWVEGTAAETGSKAMGAEGNPPLALRRTIDNGMKPNDKGQHVDFLGLYEADVIADEMQPVLQYGASLFKSRPTRPSARKTPLPSRSPKPPR